MSKKYSTYVNQKTGTVSYLLNPARKSSKYEYELKTNKRFTNNGLPKINAKTGKQMTLNKNQRSYRSGYLDARKDNSNCYKAKKNGKK